MSSGAVQMSQQVTRWLIGIAIFLAIEGLLIWKIIKTFRLGTISFDPVFWFTSNSELQAASRAADFKTTIARATHPVLFWILAGIVIAFAVAVAALFGAFAAS
jgi:hypothetical protein